MILHQEEKMTKEKEPLFRAYIRAYIHDATTTTEILCVV